MGLSLMQETSMAPRNPSRPTTISLLCKMCSLILANTMAQKRQEEVRASSSNMGTVTRTIIKAMVVNKIISSKTTPTVDMINRIMVKVTIRTTTKAMIKTITTIRDITKSTTKTKATIKARGMIKTKDTTRIRDTTKTTIKVTIKTTTRGMIRDIIIKATTKNRRKAQPTSQCQITKGFKLQQKSKRKKSLITVVLWESRKSHNSRHMEMRVTQTTTATASKARIINRTITIANSSLVITNRKRHMGKTKVATTLPAAINQKKFPILTLVAIKSRNRKKIGRHKLQEIWLQKLWHKT